MNYQEEHQPQEEARQLDMSAFDAETAAAAEAAAQEREAALARGDIFEPEQNEELEELQPDFLKTLVEDEPAGTKDDARSIPKARFDELAQQNKTMKEELKRLRQVSPQPEQQQEQAVDLRQQLRSLREQIRDANLEGDFESAEALEEQMDELRIRIAKDEINGDMNKTQIATTLQEVAAESYKSYPFLDSDSAAADADAILAVRTRRDELHRSGTPLVQALQQAIDEKGPKFAKMLGTAPEVKETVDQRTMSARAQATAASLQQPPPLKNKVDAGEFILDVSRMTEKQILALPEEVRAKLRGDVL